MISLGYLAAYVTPPEVTVKLRPDGLPRAEWVPVKLEIAGNKTSTTWGLWCRGCGEVEEIDAIPDGETGKVVLVDYFLKKHESCGGQSP